MKYNYRIIYAQEHKIFLIPLNFALKGHYTPTYAFVYHTPIVLVAKR